MHEFALSVLSLTHYSIRATSTKPSTLFVVRTVSTRTVSTLPPSWRSSPRSREFDCDTKELGQRHEAEFALCRTPLEDARAKMTRLNCLL